jgi:hypothetical protein
MIDYANAEVSRMGIFDMQVCVPWEWTDTEVEVFAEHEYPCGTQAGWQIRKNGSSLLAGDSERVQCEKYPHRCHIMLDA